MTNSRNRISTQERTNIKRARRAVKIYGTTQELKQLHSVKHQRIEVHYNDPKNQDD